VIIIGIDTHVNLIIAIAYFILRKKFYPILTFHNNVEMVFALKLKKNSWLIRYICKCIFNKISTIIAVSEGVKSNIANYFNLKNIKVIHIGISLRYYSSNESNNLKKLGKKNDVIILSAGRLEPQKDFDTVIDSVYSLRNKVTGIKLLIIGSGSEKQRLQKKVSDLSMDNIVQFIEWTDNLHEYFKICSIYVLSSHYEGFPYTLIEAMASKIPVIASDCNYGPDEILQHGKYGRLIPPQNTKAMSQAILDTIKQKKKTKEFVEKGYRRSKKFSEASMIKCYARLFRQILMHNP
jgi:glycosyltransferase involved in cell wall biosynthesis